ncbi:MAG: hypothetical protein GXY83_39525 [Rhodopirellula sp.]|nr:hypothetical protein [Rhodopirellula sp.]
MERSEFIWTFPCFILASNYTIDRETGGILLDEHIRLVAPEVTPGGKQRLAIFTDQYLAEDYADICSQRVDPIPILNRTELKKLLNRAVEVYHELVIDLNPQTRLGRVFDTASLIQAIELEEGRP